MISLRPHITEKSVNLAKAERFTLIVSSDATKASVKDAVREIFKVKAKSVNIICKKSVKQKKMRGVVLNRGFKKAIVVLKSGQKIPGFEIAQDGGLAKEAKNETKVEKIEAKIKNKK